ncbi:MULTISPECIES: insecticidal delta-endotoxin Cry8Ea1 family protein [Bacillus cereus group]|uniref:insecticidal delta-endotoxin Cry8Ea1 family protein n=1 Tax=Bacillus cereus group TaxID=86661 RepID=UPI0021CF228E|nr:insecticidal delta-endotoxin Cry8Ea1 family protein [Bacillus wiedmannii]MCU5600788.1 insecticidal delta-endotoxin Cry8Ea1 family protein [Bacillus wiedmannii]
MTKNHKKILSMTLVTSMLAGTYIPTAYTAFAETEQKEGSQENQTGLINKGSLPLDSYGLFENPYKGVTFDQFMNAFNNNTWNPLLVDIKNKGNAGSGTLTFLKGIMGTGLSLLPPPASLLGSVWNVFMPTTDTNGTDMWKQLETYIEEKIDGKIKEYHKYLMGAEFNGAMTAIKEYQRVLQIYNDSKNSLARVEEPGTPVIEAVRAADRKLKEFIAIIQTPENKADSVYQQITAPIFVQAANAHLLLQRDMILYGEEWGMDKNQWQGYKDNQKKLIQEYTNYAMNVYNDGLEKRKREAEQINTLEKYRNTDRWNHINKYVREYTLSVLDFVELFPYTDPSKYSRGTIQNNSRQIYSDIGGKIQPKERTWQDIQKILDSQEYKGDLKKLDIRSADRIDAIRAHYSERLFDATPWATTGWIGNTTGGNLKEIPSYDDPLTKVTVGSEITPFYLHLDHESGKTYSRFGSTLSGKGTASTFEYPGQKISLVHAFNRSTQPGFDGIDAIVFGFSNKNLSLKYQLATNMITTIPAEMYNLGSGFGTQVEPIHAQQKAMKTDTLNSYLRYDVKTPKTQKYKIKYRVSANESSKIRLLYNNNLVEETSIPVINNIAADTIKGEYGYYKTIEGPTVEIKAGEAVSNRLQIENGQGKFSLDHIELEPLESDEVVAQDNFDDRRLNWNNIKSIVTEGITGNAGTIGPNGDTWTYINNQLVGNSRYTLSMKVKLNSNDANVRQKVTVFTDNKNHQRVTKTVELKGGAGYQEIKLEFATDKLMHLVGLDTHIGIQTSNGNSDVLFDDVKVIGAKK